MKKTNQAPIKNILTGIVRDCEDHLDLYRDAERIGNIRKLTGSLHREKDVRLIRKIKEGKEKLEGVELDNVTQSAINKITISPQAASGGRLSDNEHEENQNGILALKLDSSILATEFPDTGKEPLAGNDEIPLKTPTATPKITKAEANLRAREVLASNNNITAKDLAKRIGCSKSLVYTLGAWVAVAEVRKEKKPTSPPAIPLTETVEAITEDTAAVDPSDEAARREEVERLTRDQTKCHSETESKKFVQRRKL